VTAFVLDASVGVTWVLQDRATAKTDGLLKRVFDEGAAAPAVWPYEMANAWLKTGRRLRMPRTAIQHEMRFLFIVLKRVAVDLDAGDADTFSTAMDLALRHALSSYDAAYVELAVRRGLPLATLDRALARAAAAEGVELLL